MSLSLCLPPTETRGRAEQGALTTMAITHAAFPACSWCGRDGIGFLRDEDHDPICVTCSLLPGPTPQPKRKRHLRAVPSLPTPAR